MSVLIGAITRETESAVHQVAEYLTGNDAIVVRLYDDIKNIRYIGTCVPSGSTSSLEYFCRLEALFSKGHARSIYIYTIKVYNIYVCVCVSACSKICDLRCEI